MDLRLQKYKNGFFRASWRRVGLASEESRSVNEVWSNLTNVYICSLSKC